MTDLTLFDAPAVRFGDPDTSRAAAESVALSKNRDCMTVLAALIDLGGRATAYQLTNALNNGERVWDQNVVARRCTDLHGAHLIFDSGHRALGRTKRPLVVWEVTGTGRQVAHDHRAAS